MDGRTTIFHLKEQDVHVFKEKSQVYYTVGNDRKKQLDYVPRSPGTIFGIGVLTSSNDRKVFLKNAASSDTIVFFENNKFQEFNTNEYFGTKVTALYADTKTYAGIIETVNGIQYYSNLYTKERDVRIERVLRYFYEHFGLNFLITIDSNHNIWVIIKRGVVYFIPALWQHFEDTGIKRAIVDIQGDNSGGVVVRTLNEYLFRYSIDKGQSEELYHSKNKILNFYVEDNSVKLLEQNKIVLYDLSDDSVKERFTGDFKEAYFEYLGNDRMLFYDGQILNIKTNKKQFLQAQVFNDYITRISSSGECAVIFVNSDVVFYDSKTDRVLSTLRNIDATKVVKISETKLALIAGKQIIITDCNGNRLGTTTLQTEARDMVKFGERFLIATGNKLYIADFVSSNGKYEFIMKQGYYTNLNNAHIQIRKLSSGDNKSFFLIGTNYGLIKVDLAGIEKTNKQYLIGPFEWAVSMNNKLLRNQSEYLFDYDQNNLEFTFSCPSYGTFGNVNYYYRLQGTNDVWKQNQSGFISFPSLPAGNYLLQAYAYSEIGGRSKTVNIPFSIMPPFWQTGYFYGLLILVTALLTITLIRFLMRRKQHIYQNRNRLIELELFSLKNQLNPHFVFNALNNLQFWMFKKDDIAVNEYIVSLSKLMRTILKNSRSEFIRLKDEMEFLHNYINIHSIKTEGSILYAINSNQSEDQNESVFIRSMVLQPFVENAVIYGLQPLKTEKRLTIFFKITESLVIVTIEDNGIGRKAADEMNINRKEKRNVWGMDILSEKSDILKKFFKEELSYSYEDLYDNGVPSGTRVTVLMKAHHFNT